MSVFSLVIEENENWKVLRSLRTLRALRPLRAIARWQGMKVSPLPLRASSTRLHSSYRLKIILFNHLDRGERFDVRDSVHLQRVTRVSGLLAHILDNGRSVLRREVL